MVPVRYKDKSYQVMFHIDEILRLNDGQYEHTERTTCTIYSGDLNEKLAEGISIRSVEDKQNVEVGLRLALGRALANLPVYASDRGFIGLIKAEFEVAIAMRSRGFYLE